MLYFELYDGRQSPLMHFPEIVNSDLEAHGCLLIDKGNYEVLVYKYFYGILI
jgi:hypothetical protein